MNDLKKNLTFDEILTELSEVARNGEGTAKMQALRALMAVESGSVAVPEPLGDEEKLELGSMILRSLGKIGAEFCYRRAFPHARDPVQHVAPKFEISDLIIDDAVLPDSLKAFYRMFPDLKGGGGFPTGFPKGRSAEAKAKWCRREAKKILLDRKQAEMDAVVAADKASDAGA